MPAPTTPAITLATLHVRRSPQAIPLAAGCLKAALPVETQHQCTLLDLFLDQSLPEMVASLLQTRPDILAFPVYLWNRPQIAALVGQLRQQAPQLTLIAGGPEATADAEALLVDLGVDLVLRGEGELTFAELIAHLGRGQAITAIHGLTFAGDDGPVSTADRPPVSDLGQLPSPWLSGALVPSPGGGVLWETARGCPFNCSFCYDARATEGVRPIPEERLVAELRLFVEAGVTQIWVLDSTFNYPAERGKRLLQLLAAHAPQIHVHLEAKADTLDRQTAQLLAAIPCSVQIGLQSADPKVLARINRALNPESFRQRIHWLAEAGVTYGFDLIYGLPGDDHAGFRTSLNWALELRPNQLDIFPLAVLPGTPLWEMSSQLGVRAMRQPPYLVEADPDTASLAAAADLFYTRGRAVGFFDALCQVSALTPVELLEAFWQWAGQRSNPHPLRQVERWTAEAILPLQIGFIQQLPKPAWQVKLMTDLVRFHYRYAETVLAAETPVARSARVDRQGRYRLAPTVHLERFEFHPEHLLALELQPPGQWPRSSEPTSVLFLRQGGEVIHEALDEGFAAFLLRCDGQQTAVEAAKDTNAGVVDEWLDFAVHQGILVAARQGA